MEQLGLIERFGQNADHASVHQLLFQLLALQRGHKDDGRPASDREQMLPKLLGVTAGHLDITNDASDVQRGVRGQKLISGRKRPYRIVKGSREALNAVANQGIIVDDGYGGSVFQLWNPFCKRIDRNSQQKIPLHDRKAA